MYLRFIHFLLLYRASTKRTAYGCALHIIYSQMSTTLHKTNDLAERLNRNKFWR